MASHDWIKNDYVTKDVPCHLILEVANIVILYESTGEFRDEVLYTVPRQWPASFDNQGRHLCPSSCLPESIAAALWWHRCVLKMNLHPRHRHCDTVAYSRRQTRRNVQMCVCYQVCFETRGNDLCKSRDVERVEEAGSVLNTGRTENGGVGGETRYIYSSSSDLIHILCFVS